MVTGTTNICTFVAFAELGLLVIAVERGLTKSNNQAIRLGDACSIMYLNAEVMRHLAMQLTIRSTSLTSFAGQSKARFCLSASLIVK